MNKTSGQTWCQKLKWRKYNFILVEAYVMLSLDGNIGLQVPLTPEPPWIGGINFCVLQQHKSCLHFLTAIIFNKRLSCYVMLMNRADILGGSGTVLFVLRFTFFFFLFLFFFSMRHVNP